jgi:vitamin B12 transporter
MKKSYLFLLLLLLLFNPILAKTFKMPRIIVTATKYPEQIENIGNTVEIITREELEQLGVNTIKQAFQLSSSISTPEAGYNLSVFLRGMASNHTKILVDGVEIKDPIVTQGGPYLDTLMLDNVEKIEIVKGAKSVLYGSDAIAGVINIITKKNKPGFFVDVAGYTDNLKSNAQYVVNLPETYLRVGYARYAAKLISAYENTEELDGIEKNSYFANFEQKLFGWKLSGSYMHSKALMDIDDYHSTTFQKCDDPNAYTNAEQDVTALKLNLPQLGMLSPELVYGVSAIKRQTINSKDDINPAENNNAYSGRINDLDFRLLLEPQENMNIILGANTKQETGKQEGNYGNLEKTQASYGYYSYLNSLNDFVNYGFGFRQGYYSGKKVDTYSLSFFRDLPILEAVIRLNLNSGYREPALYEKYSYYGNTDLKSEKSENKEISLEKQFKNMGVVLTYFDIRVTDKIDYVDLGNWQGEYQNLNGLFTSKGYEAAFALQNILFLDMFRAAYTNTVAQWGDKKALKVPQDKYSIVGATSFDKLVLSISYIAVSKRYDGFAPSYYELAPYSIVNANISYAISDYSKIYFTCNNLFNSKYQEAYGYNTPGQTLWFGFQIAP